MKLIVGLGNPGKKYEYTRHNVGFIVLDKIVMDKKWLFSKSANAKYIWLDNKTEFLKPRTFMNLSGQAVQYAMQKHKVKPQDVLVICDDLDLKLGTIRIRLEGSSGGHKGLQSIIDHIGNKFARIRVGIGSNKTKNEKLKTKSYISAEDYVLQKFPKEDTKILEQVIDRCAKLILESLDRGVREETVNIMK